MKSLRTRFLLLVLVPIIVIFSTLGTYTIYQFYQRQTKNAAELTEALAASYANEIEYELNNALVIAETVAQLIAGQVEVGQANRRATNSALRNILLSNEYIHGIWIGMEPDAYDRIDFLHVNAPGHDATGRFIPHWYRQGTEVVSNHLVGYSTPGEGDYYLLPMQTGKPQLLEPFLYDIEGMQVSMTTVAVPIKHENQVIGVAGVDITMARLHEITGTLRIFDNGFGRLLTDTGLVIYHPEHERIGKIGEEFTRPEGQEILKASQEDSITARWTDNVNLQTRTYQAYVPIKVGDIENRWVFGAIALREEMLSEVLPVFWRLVIVTVSGFLILTVAIITVSGTITKPIGALTSFIEKTASLDLRAEHQQEITSFLKKQDEVGMIARSLVAMQTALYEVTTELQEISRRMASGSQEIAASVGENSAAIEEVTSSMGAFGTNVAQARDRSLDMAQDAKLVASLATQGNTQMHESMDAMEQIVQFSEQSRAAVTALSHQVRAMEGVLEIIGDVAEQTNLLALNAAIEAARAGEYGRGFAVVADEVRSLAEQTQKSVGEINQMVNELTHNAMTSAQLMEGTEGQVRHGSELLAQTEATFNQITERINEVGRLIQEFTVTLGDMNDMGSSVAAASQEQAASMGEIAENTENLSDLGAELQRIAQRFKV